MPLDKAKFVKVMALTTSDKDGEALAALRIANKMLAAEKMTWGEVLTGVSRELKVSIQREYTADEPWVSPHLKDKVMINLMFTSVYSQPRTGNESFWQWLDDVHEKWIRYGQLTQGQYTALRNSYKRVVRTSAQR